VFAAIEAGVCTFNWFFLGLGSFLFSNALFPEFAPLGKHCGFCIVPEQIPLFSFCRICAQGNINGGFAVYFNSL
jgi:hypothetical protein